MGDCGSLEPQPVLTCVALKTPTTYYRTGDTCQGLGFGHQAEQLATRVALKTPPAYYPARKGDTSRSRIPIKPRYFGSCFCSLTWVLSPPPRTTGTSLF